MPFHVIEQDTYSVVKRLIPEGRTMCSLCSRMRRGALYRYAAEHGITKIALGHHRDDIVETLFLNLFHGGRLKAMAPKLRSDDGRHVVIRPLAYVAERDIARYARGRGFPIIPCNLCGSQQNLQRARDQAHAGRLGARASRAAPKSIFSALRNVEPAHLADTRAVRFRRPLARRDARDGPPLPNSYWVVPGELLAGEYPAGRAADRATAGAPHRAAAGAGIELLHRPDRAGRDAALPAAAAADACRYLRHADPRPARAAPRRADAATSRTTIAAALAAGRRVYLHCRAGIGRTGTVVGCYLVEQGYDGERALRELNRAVASRARGPPPGRRCRRPSSRRSTSAIGAGERDRDSARRRSTPAPR